MQAKLTQTEKCHNSDTNEMTYNFLSFLTSGLHANETVLNDVNPPHAVVAAMTDRQAH